MLSPPTASATAVPVMTSTVWFVTPEMLSVALRAGACVATITGASVVEAVLPAASVATTRNVVTPSARLLAM